MYGTEQMRINVLRYYLHGKPLREGEDSYLIEELCSIGYLAQCAYGVDLQEDYITVTELGKMYLHTRA